MKNKTINIYDLSRYPGCASARAEVCAVIGSCFLNLIPMSWISSWCIWLTSSNVHFHLNPYLTLLNIFQYLYTIIQWVNPYLSWSCPYDTSRSQTIYSLSLLLEPVIGYCRSVSALHLPPRRHALPRPHFVNHPLLLYPYIPNIHRHPRMPRPM